MNNNIISSILILTGLGLTLTGGMDVYQEYHGWSEKNTRKEIIQTNIQTTQMELDNLQQYISKQPRAKLEMNIVNTSLDFIFNVEKEGARKGVNAHVFLGDSGTGGAIDFKKIAKPVEGLKNLVKIPIKISITNWKSSGLLFSWMRNSLEKRQFMFRSLKFIAGERRSGNIEITGFVYGRES